MSRIQAATFVKYLRKFARELYLQAQGASNNAQGILATVAGIGRGILGNTLQKLFLDLKAFKWEQIAIPR